MKQIDSIKAKPVGKLDWIALIVVVLLLAALLLVLLLPRETGERVEVYHDGTLIATYDLQADIVRVQKLHGIMLSVGRGSVTVNEGALPTVGQARTLRRKGESLVLAEQALTIRVV